ncbi:YicC/YloC family endoribonuclease [Flavivirga eckloniae]|uniref:YicC family protein n=1 Tax=Flavivirga eckloniae TaxID=1803846 RepID=A0A2K9PRI0_9FLAO|nr:YicC/YloC family endoribonuclease [Flavivirga eckloniae]AUP79672.1 YicC family protein [Flavivirga eckloniae]
MIYSMTGYGKSVLQLPTKKITIELKSLNSKNLDLNARMPSIYREKELSIRKLLAAKLVRGKVDFSIYVEATAEDTSTQINTPVVKQYIEQLKNVVDGDAIELLKMAVRFPDALNTVREEIDEDEWNTIEAQINTAVSDLIEHRLDEGKVLEQDFNKRVATIDNILEQVIAIDPERIEAVRERLLKGVEELKEKYDENRFEQELVYYIEKFDITEEKVRLKNHLDYFIESINSKDSNGKKLGFISQEMGREINTIGSKSNYAPMQQLVVQMKDELEKIKEQLLNVL